MIPKGLFTQIAMLILAVAIIITYVQPAFVKIGSVQDDIGVYEEQRDKVASVNDQLAALVARMESVSNDDKRRLLTYLPDSVDEIAVSRDLVAIMAEAGVIYKSVGYSGVVDVSSKGSQEGEVMPAGSSFDLAVDGTYGQIKNFLRLLEQNQYPLEIQNLDIVQLEGGFLTANIQLNTYAYKPPEPDKQIVF